MPAVDALGPHWRRRGGAARWRRAQLEHTPDGLADVGVDKAALQRRETEDGCVRLVAALAPARMQPGPDGDQQQEKLGPQRALGTSGWAEQHRDHTEGIVQPSLQLLLVHGLRHDTPARQPQRLRRSPTKEAAGRSFNGLTRRRCGVARRRRHDVAKKRLCASEVTRNPANIGVVVAGQRERCVPNPQCSVGEHRAHAHEGGQGKRDKCAPWSGGADSC